MKTLVLADSSFCISAGQKRGDPFRIFSLYRDAYEFATCGVVTAEVLRGLRDRQVMERWRRSFANLIYLPTERSTWTLVETLLWDFERAGRRLGIQDIIIASCALEAGATVLTFDKRFAEIPNLKVISVL